MAFQIVEEKKNYMALTGGLMLYRDAMVAFIKSCLRTAYGDKAWEKGVESAFKKEELDRLVEQFNRRFSSPGGPERPGKERFEILDTNYFPNILERKENWREAFGPRLNNDRTVVEWVKEIVWYRNAAAHAETGDMNGVDAIAGLILAIKILRYIDKSASAKVEKILDGLSGNLSQPQVISQLSGQHLAEWGFDYELGFAQLDQAIQHTVGAEHLAESIDYENFSNHKRQVLEALSEEQEKGVVDQTKLYQKENALHELNRQSLQYLGKPFGDLCQFKRVVIDLDPEQARAKLAELDKKIADQKDTLDYLRYKSLQQQRTSVTLETLERRIEETQADLEALIEERNTLWEKISPACYFKVARKVDPAAGGIFEEQPFTVTVDIHNEGTKPGKIVYQEGFSETICLVDGTITLEGEIPPEETLTLQYRCYATSTHHATLFTQKLDYLDKVKGWDELEETHIAPQKGAKPYLEVHRYYRYEPNGLEIVIRLHNIGDKIAHKVCFSERLEHAATGQTYCLSTDGINLIPCGMIDKNCLIHANEIENIHTPSRLVITYQDNQGAHYTRLLDEPYDLLDELLPNVPKLVGREKELKRLTETLARVSVPPGAGYPPIKKIILIEGIEGVGKTRLVQEAIGIAQNMGFETYIEDSKKRTPIKRIFLQMLRLDPDRVDPETVWSHLGADIQKRMLHVPLVFEYLCSQSQEVKGLSDIEVANITADLIRLFTHVTEHFPVFLVVENIHLLPEGLERRILGSLLDQSLISSHSRVLTCLTYRPTGEILPDAIRDCNLQNSGYEKLVLKEIEPTDTAALIDQLIVFPRFCQDLKKSVFQWSKGNPLYLIELLRFLIKANKKYLLRIGNEWLPNSTFSEDEIPATIESLILERVYTELKPALPFLRLLSVIGLDLPYRLVAPVARSHLGYSEIDIYNRLVMLEKAGMLICARPAVLAEDDVHDYEFEHEIKREVIYSRDDDFSDREKTLIRNVIVSTLNNEVIYQDPSENTIQLARHLVRSSLDTQKKQLQKIIDAAQLEARRRNFSRALEFYARVLQLMPDSQLEYISLLIERVQIYLTIGDWGHVDEEVKRGLSLLNQNHHPYQGESRARLKTLTGIMKRIQGSVYVHNHKTYEANEILVKARGQFEGFLEFRRRFPPHDRIFFNELVEIYLLLAEIFTFGELAHERDTLFTKEYLTTCSDRAFQLAQTAAKQFQDSWLLIRVYIHLGQLHLKSKNYDMALKYLEQAVDYFKSLPADQKDSFNEERAKVFLAEVYREQGQLPRALQFYREAQALQEEIEDQVGLSISASGIGEIFFDQNKLSESKQACLNAYRYLQQTDDTNRFWRIALLLTRISLHEADILAAYDYWMVTRRTLFQKAIYDSLPGKQRDHINQALQDLLKHFETLHDGEKVIELLRDKIKLFSTDKNKKINAQQDLGTILLRLKKFEEAAETYNEVLSATKDPMVMAEIHAKMAEAIVQSHKTNLPAGFDSFDHFQQAIYQYIKARSMQMAYKVYQEMLKEIASNEGFVPRLSNAIIDFLEAMLVYGALDSRYIDEALKVLVDHKNYSVAADLLVYTARIAIRLVDQNFPVSQIVAYLESAEVLYRKGTREDLIWGLEMLIASYFLLNKVASKAAESPESEMIDERRIWGAITRLFKDLLQEYIDNENTKELYYAFSSYIRLIDVAIIKEIEDIANDILWCIDQEWYTKEYETPMLLYIAKLFFEFHDKTDDHDDQMRYLYLSLSYYNQVLEAEQNNKQFVPSVYNDQALVYAELGLMDEAVDTIVRAIALSQQETDRLGEAHARINYGGILKQLGRIDEASDQYTQGIGIIYQRVQTWRRRLEDQNSEPLSSSDIGRYYFDCRWYAQAAVNFAMLLLIHKQERTEAISFLSEAVKIFTELGNTDEAAQIKSLILKIQTTTDFLFNFSEFDMDTHETFALCPICGGVMVHDYCRECGIRRCPHCGIFLSRNTQFCPECDNFLL